MKLIGKLCWVSPAIAVASIAVNVLAAVDRPNRQRQLDCRQQAKRTHSCVSRKDESTAAKAEGKAINGAVDGTA